MKKCLGKPGGPEMAQKGYWDFNKNLVHYYVLYLFEYESTDDLLSFYKNHISEKNLVLQLQFKNL